MTLNRKLSVWFVVVALIVGAAGVIWVQRAQVLKRRLNEFANLTTPALVALGQMKAAAIEFVAVPSQPSQEAYGRFREWLAVYRGVASDSGEQATADRLEEAGARLQRQAVESGGTHEAERAFAKDIDAAIALKLVALKRQREAVNRHAAAAVRLSILAVAVFAILAVGVGGLLAGSLARPIIRLSEDVARVGAGDLRHRTAVRSGDEIGALAQALNRMTENLERTTVSKAALEKAYAELQRAQQQLVQSEKLAALGRFSAGVAHEVKNPLAVILGGVEFLGQQLAGADADTKTALAMIEKSVQRADTIVRDLLKFARPSAASKERVRPEELVNGTIALLTYGGSLKQVTATTRFAHGETALEVDKNQVQQVLLNLMMNAVDAMPAGGSLTAATSLTRLADRPACAISVIDTGEGIAPEALPRLFEPFFTTKRDKKGTGLGLSISKTIVESHGGTLTVESAQGSGTTMTVTLPVSAEGSAA